MEMDQVRIPLWWVVVLFGTISICLLFSGDGQTLLSARVIHFEFGLLFGIAALLTWRLGNRHYQTGRWFATLIFTGIVGINLVWLPIPVLVFLLPVPIIMAGLLLDLKKATAIALLTTVAILFTQFPQLTLKSNELAMLVLTMCWLTLAALIVIGRPLQQELTNLWGKYDEARHALSAVRESRVALHQALDSLVQANRQLDLMNERLTAMRRQTEAAQNAKLAFVANVSHEFRTPLNLITGLISLVLEKAELYGDGLPPALLEDLGIVHRNCEHLTSMVSDVLDLSQSETGHFGLYKAWANLCDEIGSAVNIVRPFAERKGLHLTVSRPADLPLVLCDRTRIRQVLLNLLSNAARYTEQGGITLQVAQQMRHLLITITDSGPGIAAPDLNRLFEPFYRGMAADGRIQGSGLGLSISKQLIELHDGQLWAESTVGVGSTFCVKLPIAPLTSESKPDRWIDPDWIWRTGLARARVPVSPYKARLVVCDRTGELLPALARCSHEVEFIDAPTLPDAVQQAQQTPAHALLINAEHPDSLSTLVQEAQTLLPDTPIIGCTFPSAEASIRALGALTYLIKPVTRADLRRALELTGPIVRRILLVDDDGEFQQMLVRMLLTLNDTLEINTVSSGDAGLAAMASWQPDLVLLDIKLPQLDGWQVLQRKAQDPAIQTIPTIVLSAHDPLEQPPLSRLVMVTMGQGLSVSKLLRYSLETSALLLSNDHGAA